MDKEDSILENYRKAVKNIGNGQDYFAYVHLFREFIIELTDITALSKLKNDIDKEIPNNESVSKTLTYKDGHRRFDKLVKTINSNNTKFKCFLTGDSFDECLKQYLKIITCVENTWLNATKQYKSKNYPLATFLSILTLEEVGKLSCLWRDLLAYDLPNCKDNSMPRNLLKHKNKHFIGVTSGALINNRIDRILGKDKVRKVIEDAENGKLEQFRQSCIYLDFVKGKITTPEETVDENKARFFTVLAGEIMSEVLGHFPWEFERMIKSVIKYEESIGFDKATIKLS